MRRGYYFVAATALLLGSCAKLMEDQPPGTADSSLVGDTAAGDSAGATGTGPKVPERFLQFFYREFTGTVSPTGGRVHTLVVETVMDVTIEAKTEAQGLVFAIKKDGLDITEEPASKWQGRLVPGRYVITVLPGKHASYTKGTPYSLTVKEE